MSDNKTLTAILAIISIFLLGAVAFGLTQIDSLNSSKAATNTTSGSKQASTIPKNGEVDMDLETKLGQDFETIRLNNEIALDKDLSEQNQPKDPKKEISAINATGVSENKPKTILETVSNYPEISVFLSAVKAAGLEDDLKSEGPLTIFAPDNESFTKYLSPESLAQLQKPEKKADLARILKFHIIAGLELNKDLIEGKELTTLENGKLTIVVNENGKKSIDGIEIVKPDLVSSNGVVHIINRLIQE